MGIQLARKGNEYRRRCAFRIPVNKGGNVYTPASFPALPVQEESSDEYLKNIAIPQEDLDELHALLVLEKFVMFSQVCARFSRVIFVLTRLQALLNSGLPLRPFLHR